MQSGFYVRGDFGGSWAHVAIKPNLESDIDNFIFGGGVGYRVNRNFRMDATAEYGGGYNMQRKHLPKLSTGHYNRYSFQPITVMGNAYVEVPVTAVLSPYLGMGAGYSVFSHETQNFKGPHPLEAQMKTDGGFTWAAMAGVGISVTEQFGFDLGYRYRQILVEGPWDFNDHSLRAGLRYTF